MKWILKIGRIFADFVGVHAAQKSGIDLIRVHLLAVDILDV